MKKNKDNQQEPMEQKGTNINQPENYESRCFDIEMEIREEEDEPKKVVGYASVFNSRSENLGGFYEKIDERAFDDCLNSKDLDCRALFNHDPNLILARTPKTLKLSVDKRGLKYEFDAPNTTTGKDLLENLRNGNITQSSFGFFVAEDQWTTDAEGRDMRLIKKVGRLLDISPVTYPAYTEASVGLAQRKYETIKKEREDNIIEAQKLEEEAKKKERDNDLLKLKLKVAIAKNK